MRPFLLAAFLVAVTGCKLVVLGDSNSCLWPTGCAERNTLWPLYMTQLPDWPRWTMVNRAIPSMVAGAYARDGKLGDGQPASGTWRLDQIAQTDLANYCRTLPGMLGFRAKLVIALGTNDVARTDVTAQLTALAVVALYNRAQSISCVDTYVATIPPRQSADRTKVAIANMMVRALVPADRIIPFGDEPVSDLDWSGVHMTDEAQHRRAETVLRVLFPPRQG